MHAVAATITLYNITVINVKYFLNSNAQSFHRLLGNDFINQYTGVTLEYGSQLVPYQIPFLSHYNDLRFLVITT